MRRTIMGVFLGLSLLLNVLVVSVTSVATAVGGLFEAVTGVASVIGVVTNDREKLMREITELRGEVKTLRGQLEVDYGGRKRQIRDVVSETTERIAKRTAVGVARNVGSVFAEALPVVGVAVIVSATWMEIDDGCDTIRDLRELDIALNPVRDFGPEESEVCGLRVPSEEEVWETIKGSPGRVWGQAKETFNDLPEFDSAWMTDWFTDFPLPW